MAGITRIRGSYCGAMIAPRNIAPLRQQVNVDLTRWDSEPDARSAGRGSHAWEMDGIPPQIGRTLSAVPMTNPSLQAIVL
jgi:hypothetical protein